MFLFGFISKSFDFLVYNSNLQNGRFCHHKIQWTLFTGKLDVKSGSHNLLEDTQITLDLLEATDATSSSDGQVLKYFNIYTL